VQTHTDSVMFVSLLTSGAASGLWSRREIFLTGAVNAAKVLFTCSRECEKEQFHRFIFTMGCRFFATFKIGRPQESVRDHQNALSSGVERSCVSESLRLALGFQQSAITCRPD
jgi:hypothetical protein